MKKQISIIGGGPSALILAAFLDETKFNVTIYEQNKTLGRKFLVAGNGGFNLTHSEPISGMINRYTSTEFLQPTLLNFTNTNLRNWLKSIGVPTFIGSSGRIYPEKGIKPIEVLNAFLEVLKQKKVKVIYQKKWVGWTKNNAIKFKDGTLIESDFTVFSLGGGSWNVTGSDGHWLNLFKNKGIKTIPFYASNCAYEINWKSNFIQKTEGEPLKNISITCSGNTQKGEVVVTKFGLEGNAIYALSPQIRALLKANGQAEISIDLKPNSSENSIIQKLEHSTCKNITETLKKDLKLSSPQLELVKNYVSKADFLNPSVLASQLKCLKLIVLETEVLDKAISTVGGINLNAVDESFQLNEIPNQYCIGEMLDWDAPTGGYLLQACFSMGVQLSNHLNQIKKETD